MRVSDDRYSRDLQRLNLAMRFIHHEARTQTIRAWTGLTDDRIRKLYRTYVSEAGAAAVPRHRGKSPQQAAYFSRTPRLQLETGTLASYLSMLNVVPPHGAREGFRSVASIARGQALCEAYEMYRSVVRCAQISFEHAVFLVRALCQGDELRLGNCVDCDSVVVIDRLSLRDSRCVPCSAASARREPANPNRRVA